MSLVRI